MLNIISSAKNELIGIDEFWKNAQGDWRMKKAAEVYEAYQGELKKNNALDFDDLIFKTVDLFRVNGEVLDYYQERFRYIILPLLIPALSSSVIYNLIGGLKLYDVIIALTDGGPAKKTHSLATYIANRYFDAERAGYAAAIGVFSFLMIMVISMIVNAFFRKKEVEL